MFVMKRLEHVAEAVKLGDSKQARLQILRDRLKEIVLPAVFKLPLNPHLRVIYNNNFIFRLLCSL